MVLFYGWLTNDRIIEKEAVIKYTDEEKLKPIKERFLPRDLNIGIKSFTAMQPKESVPQNNEKILQNYQALGLALTQGSTLKEEFRLLEKAFEEIDLNNNYKYALLESFIVAESLISRLLRKIKLEKGVSKGKLEDYETEVGIGYQINVEIPVLFDDLTNDERQILGNVDKIRKVRNKVVHEGISVSEETALEAINSVSNLIAMFSTRNLS